MKKLFFAALIALAGFTACGTKNVETAATEATEQREVGGGDIAYVQVEAVLAQSDLYNAEGIALKDKTEKAQKSWAQKEQNFQMKIQLQMVFLRLRNHYQIHPHNPFLLLMQFLTSSLASLLPHN